jgi:pimeloyl-ACP methyl ester carboxylesterase
MAAYYSDGLRIYARVDTPTTPMPESGYPVIVFVHGWMGVQAAPSTDFYMDENSMYDKMIHAYTEAGFTVFTPGWRGHGTINGIPADGIEFLQAWDNSTYLSPVFYAIDTLNLIDGLDSYKGATLDLDNVNLVSHSQGGDVALIALAVAGEGSRVRQKISAASFWSACFPARDTQFRTYQAMENSPQAFLSGDGSWTGTAISENGDINPAFIFGYPADWIDSPNVDEWTWQHDVFSTPTVAAVIESRLAERYDAINKQVADVNDADYEFIAYPDGAFKIIDDSRIATSMSNIDAFEMEEYLSESILLHYSDRDFYSLPEWNADLCDRVRATGGSCQNFEYAENTHSLGVSDNNWFSSASAKPGFEEALKRDIDLFSK